MEGWGDSWLRAGWGRFQRWVVARSRFLLEPPSEEDHEYGQSPQEMLDEIGGLILGEGLVEPLPAGTLIYRQESLAMEIGAVEAREMSAPPRNSRRQGA